MQKTHSQKQNYKQQNYRKPKTINMQTTKNKRLTTNRKQLQKNYRMQKRTPKPYKQKIQANKMTNKTITENGNGKKPRATKTNYKNKTQRIRKQELHDKEKIQARK